MRPRSDDDEPAAVMRCGIVTRDDAVLDVEI
jgi:hypothetical protein